MWQIISNYLEVYIGIFILGIGEILFAKISLNQKKLDNKIKTLIVLLIATIFYTIIYVNMTGLEKTLAIYIVHVFEYKQICNISYAKSIFLTFIYLMLIIGLEIFQLLVMTNIIGFSTNYYYEVYGGSIIGNIITGALLIIVTYSFKKILWKLTQAKLETNVKIIMFSLLTLLCSVMFLYTIIKKFRIGGDILLYLISNSVLITILFTLIRQTIKNNNLLKEYDNLLEFMTTYENEIENQRILRHEIKNEFRTIRAKICDNQEKKEIIEYIDEIVNDKYEVNKEEYAQLGYLPPNGIKGLCYFKVQEAENKGIKISLNVSKRIKESTIYKLNVKQQRDFGRIIGVILDNAIEASQETKDKKIGIEAYVNKEKEFQIIITNTYKNKIDKNKIGKEPYSTKGKTRGHGLILVKQLVEKNTIFETKTDVQEELYIQTIKIKKL